MLDRNNRIRSVKSRRVVDVRARSTIAGIGLACCLWGETSLAQSEINIDPRFFADPIALGPYGNDPGNLIDFAAFGTGQQPVPSAAAHPATDPVSSLQAIATRWLNAITANTPTSRARQPERPVILEPGYGANRAWSAVKIPPSTTANLENWLGVAPGQAWAGKALVKRDRPFLPAAFTRSPRPLGAAAVAGQVDLIVFDVALTPDGQGLRLRGDRPPTIITAALGSAGDSVSASSAAAWPQGLGPDANIPPSGWRTPPLATPRGRSATASLTASIGDGPPAGERLIVLQGLTPEDGAVLQDLAFLQSGSPSTFGSEPGDTNPGQRPRRAAVVFDDGWLFANGITLPVGRLDLSGPADDKDGGRIAFIPFIDTGRGWNTEIPAAIDIYDPWSIGVGIGWQMTNRTGIRLGVDTPLNGADLPDTADPEDFGLQLRLATEFGN